jgi:hypothetical protein
MNADSGRYPPGVYEEDGALHFDLEAMVRGAGYEPTPDNLLAMEKAALAMAAQIGGSRHHHHQQARDMTPNADSGRVISGPADPFDVLLCILGRRGIGRNPTDAQLIEAAEWMHTVLDALADCGYRLEATSGT